MPGFFEIGPILWALVLEDGKYKTNALGGFTVLLLFFFFFEMLLNSQATQLETIQSSIQFLFSKYLVKLMNAIPQIFNAQTSMSATA
jgi:hypothetical protein